MRLAALPEAGLPPGLDVYRLDFDLGADAQRYATGLTTAEQHRMQRLARHADRLRFAQTRLALRRLLGTRLGCAPEAVRIVVGRHGKPQLDDTAALPAVFNVSHAGAHALLGVADGALGLALGVDIEHCRADLEWRAMQDLALTRAEREDMAGADDACHAFYHRWVAKEAVLKAIGVGVAQHLQAVSVFPRARTQGAIGVDCLLPCWRGGQALMLGAPSGYAAALAWCLRPQH